VSRAGNCQLIAPSRRRNCSPSLSDGSTKAGSCRQTKPSFFRSKNGPLKAEQHRASADPYRLGDSSGSSGSYHASHQTFSGRAPRPQDGSRHFSNGATTFLPRSGRPRNTASTRHRQATRSLQGGGGRGLGADHIALVPFGRHAIGPRKPRGPDSRRRLRRAEPACRHTGPAPGVWLFPEIAKPAISSSDAGPSPSIEACRGERNQHGQLLLPAAALRGGELPRAHEHAADPAAGCATERPGDDRPATAIGRNWNTTSAATFRCIAEPPTRLAKRSYRHPLRATRRAGEMQDRNRLGRRCKGIHSLPEHKQASLSDRPTTSAGVPCHDHDPARSAREAHRSQRHHR